MPVVTDTDLAWLKGEIKHCRRMEYAAEAQRFERIYAALLTAPCDTRPEGEDGTASFTSGAVRNEDSADAHTK